jgi:thiamine-monophosphate kinase
MAARQRGRDLGKPARKSGQDVEKPARGRGQQPKPARTRISRRSGPTSADSDEFALLAEVRIAVEKLGRGRGVVVGIGDDCAVVESRGRQVLTTDSMIEGVHFLAGWLTPRELGVRAFRAAVSDIAAMGALPRYVLLSLEVPGDAAGFGSRESLALVRALAAEAKAAGAALVGGNVSRASRTGLTVTIVGEPVAKPVLRSGARAGDFVFVTGTLGGAAAGCSTLLSRAVQSEKGRPSQTAAYRRPPLRLDFAAALARRSIASAMIDVSDGLLQDLGHLAKCSGVAVLLDASMVPVHRAAKLVAAGAGRSSVRSAASTARTSSVRSAAAQTSAHGSHPAALTPEVHLALSGGEDYELAFTARESSCAAIERIAAECGVPVAVIGVVQKGRPGVTDLAGGPFGLGDKGFDHLRPKRAKASLRASDARKRR